MLKSISSNFIITPSALNTTPNNFPIFNVKLNSTLVTPYIYCQVKKKKKIKPINFSSFIYYSFLNNFPFNIINNNNNNIFFFFFVCFLNILI